MKLPILLAAALATLGVPLSLEAQAGDAYSLKAEIYVFRGADVSQATAMARGFATTLAGNGKWSVLASPLEIKCGTETLTVRGPQFWWGGVAGDSAKFNLVSSPEAAMTAGKEVKVTIGESTQYLERQQDGTFRLREVAAGSPDSAHCDLLITATPDGSAAGALSISCRPEITNIRARERIAGVDLDVGKPILTSSRDDLKFTAMPGDWSCLFNQAPGGSDYGLLVLIKVSEVPLHSAVVAAPSPVPAAPSTGPATTSGDTIRVGVVVEVTDEGRKLAHPSPDRPTYYTPVVLGYREMGGVLDFWQRPPPPAADVERALVRALASQGYVVATAPAPASQVLVFRWGVVDPETHPYFEAKDSAIDDIEPVNESEMLALVVGQPWYTIYPTYNPNARELLTDLKEKSSSRYFLIVSALDASAYANHRQVLLWRAHVTTNYWGHYLDQVLGTLISSATPSFGRETPMPLMMTVPAAPVD